ncbi:MAG: flagellar hook-length control protein FliK, partial [Selenomonas sp.]|nr:flagellar hook-length control protein FliK [Selenomonas sp.]
MLSGQQVKFPDEKEGNTSVQPMTQVQKTATMLEVQLSNHQLANKEGIQENVLMPSQDLRLNSLQGMNLNLLPNERLSNSSLANPVVFPEEGTGNPHLVNQTVGQETGQERWQNVYPEMERGSFSSGSQTVGQVSVDNIIEGHLDAQGNLNNPQFTILNNGRERVEAKGMAPFEQSEETMPSMPAGRVNDSVTLQETGRVIIPEGVMQIQNPRKEDSPSGNTLLAGVNITVEDETPVMPAPSMGVIISEGAMQMQNPQKKDSPSGNTLLTGVNITVEDDPPVMPAPSMDLQEDFQRGAYRQNQAAVPETEVVPDEEGELVSQLVEEAVGDKAPTQREPVQSGSNGPVSMFQQSLNESLTGARTANAVNQSQNAQEDFNVPQQIVEQARLLRRGEDTQMVIKLHPEHLGELTLKVSVSANGAVNASFHSDNAQVRAIIENTLVQLKQELNNQGLK